MPNDFNAAVRSIVGWAIAAVLLIVVLVILSFLWA